MKSMVAWMVVIGLAGPVAMARAEGPMGSLVIIGGGLRFNEPEVWTQVIDLAGGSGARIAVFPTASDEPAKSGGRAVEVLRRYGADAFLVPVAVKNFDVDCRQAVIDKDLIEQVRTAGGVFFVGGAQSRIVQALYMDDRRHTPMLDAIWEVYHRGGVVAGTSAGAAVMSQVMYRDPPGVLETLSRGVRMGKEIDRGLGFLRPEWFVEQHCLARGRFARALVAMHSQGIQYGIGVDENTALVVRNGSNVKVAGYRGAVVLDLSEATHDPALPAFNLKNARLSYLDHGDSFNLETKELTPAPEKREDLRIDPNGQDFKPFEDKPLFTTDILGNNTVADLMTRLIEHKAHEAIGLAFSGHAAREQPTQGFEFRFYREKDSVGWYTESQGSDDYTVQNIHLDIRPVEVTGPLYR